VSLSVLPSRGGRFWEADVFLTPAARRLHDPASLLHPSGGSALDLTVFVSCYNEAPYIVSTLDTVCAAAREAGVTFEIIVIDDGSRDNSREVVRAYIDSHPDENIILRANPWNKGLAQNYVDAAFLGKGKYYRLVCGDSGEPKDSMAAVLRAIGEADCIVPYYVVNKGRNPWRQFLSALYTRVINLVTGNRIHYYNGLAVHLRHNVMRWHPNTRGFGFQADILCQLLDLGFTYKEVPIVTAERRRGHSNALVFRNWLSVAHSVVEIIIRRASRSVYPQVRHRAAARREGGESGERAAE
jgi:glycosyltransferase involved in cell wall biosynthesis